MSIFSKISRLSFQNNSVKYVVYFKSYYSITVTISLRGYNISLIEVSIKTSLFLLRKRSPRGPDHERSGPRKVHSDLFSFV